MLNQALKYLALGWSIIPVEPKGKNPIKGFLWKKYQTEKPTETEVRDWFSKFPDANIGIITGQISGLIVVDIDGDKGKTSALSLEMPSTIIAETGRGFHYFYKSNGSPISNKVGIFEGIDIRGDGGYVVAPPSIHASGKVYQWAEWCDPWENALSDPPAWIKAALTGKPKEIEKKDFWKVAGEGERDETLTSLAGHLYRLKLPRNEVYQILSKTNQTYRPPLLESDVLRITNSIKKYHVEENNIEIKPITINANELLAQPDEPIKWLVKDLWTCGSVGFISGESKSFKTYFALDMAVSIVGGVPVMNQFETKQGKVIFIEEENRSSDMRRRIRAFIKEKGIHHYPEKVLNNFELLIQKRVSLDDEMWANWLRELCSKNKGATLFLDCLSRIHSKNENSAEDMRPILKLLRELQVEYDVSIVVLHHTKKPPEIKSEQRGHTKMRGTSDFAAWYDCFLGFEIAVKDKTVAVEVLHRDAPAIDSFSFDLNDDHESGIIELVYKPSDSEEIMILNTVNDIENIVLKSRDGILQVDLYKQIGGRKNILLEASKRALAGKTVVRIKQGDGKNGHKTYVWYVKEL